MRNIWSLYILLNLIGAASIYFYAGVDPSATFLVGGAMLAVTFLLQSWAWSFVKPNAAKKLVAFAVPLIVMKYLLFGAIIYWVTKVQKWDPVYFCLGVSSFVLAIVLQPLWIKRSKTIPSDAPESEL